MDFFLISEFTLFVSALNIMRNKLNVSVFLC